MSSTSDPLRVLHLYAGNLYGGIEKLLLTLAAERHLCPEMVPVFGLCFEGRLADELRATGVTVHMLGNVRMSRPWTMWRARYRLRKLLKTSPSFDRVITHSTWLHAVFAPAVRRMKKPLILWAHDAYLKISRIDRIAARTKPDHIIANSDFTRGTLPLLFPGVPDQTLYYPLPPAPQMDREAVRMQTREALGCSPQTTVIFMGARLEWWKGHQLLIESLSHLKPGDWQAWIAGGPQRPHEEVYYAELKAMAKRLGVDQRIVWLGQRKDVPRLLAAADIHCQPNTGPEPFGIVFIEALQAGLPVVTTRIGAAPEIVDDTCGVLAPPDDANAIAAVLDGLIGPGSRTSFAGGPARAELLCDPAQQLNRLRTLLAAT